MERPYENQRPTRHNSKCSAGSTFASRQWMSLGAFYPDRSGTGGRQRVNRPRRNGRWGPIERRDVSLPQIGSPWLGPLPTRRIKVPRRQPDSVALQQSYSDTRRARVRLPGSSRTSLGSPHFGNFGRSFERSHRICFVLVLSLSKSWEWERRGSDCQAPRFPRPEIEIRTRFQDP